MQRDIVFVKTNKLWDDHPNPLVTIITSNYNRREVLYRCMRSIESQTFRDLEYIVVDNGSSVSFDDIMEKFMAEATIPIMFVKRNNGIGRQSGRNSAIRRARGEYLAILDSDDEYLPNGIERLVKAWMQIPEEKRQEYREVCCLVQDEYGHQIGPKFPEHINNLSHLAALAVVMKPEYSCEHANMSRTILLKENLFPEPEGVSNYQECIIWWKLSKHYKSYFFNDIAKRYYTSSSDSITNDDKKGINYMNSIGSYFTYLYYLNHWDDYFFDFKERCRIVIFYNIYKDILQSRRRLPSYAWTNENLHGIINNVLNICLWLPSKMFKRFYIKHHNGLNIS